MKKINNKNDIVNLSMNGGNLNIIFLLIVVVIIYLFFNYNVESLVKNKQFNDNIRYIKTSISQFISNNESKIKIDFFKTNGVSSINKSGNINLNNFLPQINNLGIQNSSLNNIINDTNNNPINNYSNNNDSEDINRLR